MIELAVLLIVLGFFALVGVLYAYSIRNAIVRKCRELTASWNLLMEAVRDRAETLPKLVAEVKHTTGFEEDVFHEVEAAVASLSTAQKPRDVCAAIEAGRGSMAHLCQIAEYYPKLASSQHFLALRAEATEAEVRLERERGIYNRTVHEYNDLISKSAFGRHYAKRVRLLPNEKVENCAQPAGSGPTTSPIQLASVLN